MFSKACEYGIRATIYIAGKSQQGHMVGLREIASSIDSPEAFTAKILQQLVRAGIISSAKGPNGGFEISAQKLKALYLSRIVEAIDGDSIFKGCGLGLKECDEQRPCPVHDKFVAIREELKVMLESTSVLELCTRVQIGETYLMR